MAFAAKLATGLVFKFIPKFIHHQKFLKLSLKNICTLQSYVLPTMTSGKLKSAHFQSLLNPELLRLEELFLSEGYSLRLVGGAVRDLLLGINPKDIDLATDCTPDTMIQLFEKWEFRFIPTGLQHGTITVHTKAADYEITTLRIDRVTDGRHAIVQFTSDWKVDSERRDLTINSMSLGFDGTLYDYFEGQRHLTEKKILFVGDARARIQEDYLRILRYFRFYGRICQSIHNHDSDTLAAIRENASGLQNISVERIWLEMSRILVGNIAPHLIQLMYELGVAQNIALPTDGTLTELGKVWNNMHTNYHLKPVSVLVSLVKSAEESERLCRKWKLSNSERKLGVYVASQRDICYEGTPLKYYQDLLTDGELKEHVIEVLLYCNRVKDKREIEVWRVPFCPVNGHDLKKIGLVGLNLGSTLKNLKQKWKDSNFSLTKEELLNMI